MSIRLRFLWLLTVSAAARVVAQTPNALPEPPAASTTTLVTTNAPVVVLDDTGEKAWAFSLSAYTYLVPDDRDYVQPTVTADRGWLHLEARYNYEDLDTGSLWVGYNLNVGDTISLEFTPMLGGVFGETTGIAPGYKGSLSWWRLELSTEGEYVIPAGDPSDRFFYTWSELTLSPVDWFRFGMATQRTRLYKTEREIQRGVLAGFSFWKMDLTGYVFDPDQSKPTFVLAAGLSF